jgi:MIP family channel proteins
MPFKLNVFLAELIGTFILVFIGGLAVVVTNNPGNVGALAVVIPALAHGLVLIGIISMFGHHGGAHFNPAVTASLVVGGKLSLPSAIQYWIAQVIGALVAGFLVVAVSNGSGIPEYAGLAGETTGALTSSSLLVAGLVELILTFILVTVVYQAAVYGKAGNTAGIAIGFTLAACIAAAGTLTGASLNPARTLGPAIAGGNFDYVPVYLIGIFLGGILGGIVNTTVLKPDSQP